MRALARLVLQRIPLERIFTLVDVGSMGGVEPEWQPFEAQIRIIGFEPDEREFAQLSSSPQRLYLNVALAEASQPLTFYISREPGKSSSYQPNFDLLRQFPRVERFETVGTVHLPAERVQSLGAALSDRQIAELDFLKLDTQGSELSILKGSGEYLTRRALGLRVEVEFSELYCGQPLFAEVDTFIRQVGFQLMDLQRYYWKRYAAPGRGQLVFGEALYFRNPANFRQHMIGAETPYARDKTLKFVALALVYGMSDFAHAVLQQAREAGHLPDALAEELVRHIQAEERRRPWVFPGSARLGLLLYRLERRLAHRGLGWADSDSFLGDS